VLSIDIGLNRNCLAEDSCSCKILCCIRTHGAVFEEEEHVFEFQRKALGGPVSRLPDNNAISVAGHSTPFLVYRSNIDTSWCHKKK
jgi:hypothetical protein